MNDTTANVQTPVSPKAWSAGALTLAAGIVAAICTTVLGNPHIVDALPVWAQGIIIGVLPAIAAWVGVYLKRDPLRDVGAQATADYVLDPVEVAHAQAPMLGAPAEPAPAEDVQEPGDVKPLDPRQPVTLTPEQADALARLAAARQLPKYAASLEGFTNGAE